MEWPSEWKAECGAPGDAVGHDHPAVCRLARGHHFGLRSLVAVRVEPAAVLLDKGVVDSSVGMVEDFHDARTGVLATKWPAREK